MVIDTLAQLESYAALDARFGETAKFIEKCRTENLPAGRYELDGDRLYAMVMDYVPEEKAEPLYETHDKYVDIQCMLEGSEYQWYAPRGELKEKIAYNTEKDISFYEFSGSGSRLHLTEGSFAVYFPQDGHLPGMADGSCGKCRRIVVKLKWYALPQRKRPALP